MTKPDVFLEPDRTTVTKMGNAIRSRPYKSDAVLDELEQLLCAHHKYVGSYRVITGTNEEIYDELFDAIQKLRQQERENNGH